MGNLTLKNKIKKTENSKTTAKFYERKPLISLQTTKFITYTYLSHNSHQEEE